MVLSLFVFPLPNLTSLPHPCRWDKLRKDTLTFNYSQFQDTRMCLLKPEGLVNAFTTLHS